MTTETIISTPRAEREHTSYIAEGRVARAHSEQGALRCGWQTANGMLTCRWNWVALRGEDNAESNALAA